MLSNKIESNTIILLDREEFDCLVKYSYEEIDTAERDGLKYALNFYNQNLIK